MKMDKGEFEKLVQEAVDDLPGEIRIMMENVAIITDDVPTAEQLKKAGIRRGDFLLGLYEGIPQNVWGKGFGGNLPDKITIFQKSIETFAATPDNIKQMIKGVIRHEIAHHFGFDEKGARRLGRKDNS
jgi:predicted Zn-dependent protease with MMP-like domain